MKLDMATLGKLNSMGVKSVAANNDGQIDCVEFFPQAIEAPQAQFVLPDGTPMDRAMQRLLWSWPKQTPRPKQHTKKENDRNSSSTAVRQQLGNTDDQRSWFV